MGKTEEKTNENNTKNKIEFFKYSIIPKQFNDNTQKKIDYDNYLKERNDYINEAKELNDKHILVQNEITWAMNDYGVILYNSEHIDDAKHIWKKSGNLGDPQAYLYLFIHFAFKKNTNKQIYYCEKEIEYGNIDRCLCLFNHYYNTKNWKKTDEYMEKYIQLGGKKHLFEMILKTNNKRSNDAENHTNQNFESLKKKVEITHKKTNEISILFCIMNLFVIIQNIIIYNTIENFHVLNIWISCFVNGIFLVVIIINGILFNNLFEKNKKNKDL